MKVELFPFQKTALARLRQSVATALGNYRSTHTPQVVSYTAPTGSLLTESPIPPLISFNTWSV